MSIALLDRILSWYAYSRNSEPYGSLNELTRDFNEWENGSYKDYLGNLQIDLLKIVEKLMEDKYIISRGRIYQEGEEVYSITFNGALFIDSGGYATKFSNERAERLKNEAEVERIKNVDREILKNGVTLNKLTCVLGIGTIGLLLFEIYKFFIEHNLVFVRQ